jgi:hypothetical protein
MGVTEVPSACLIEFEKETGDLKKYKVTELTPEGFEEAL